MEAEDEGAKWTFRDSSTNCPFCLLFLFLGGGGLSERFRGFSAPFTRKTTSRQRLQSSSSSYKTFSDWQPRTVLSYKKLTFIFRKRVMTPTASVDNGTGEPIPISCPVSRGSSFVVVGCSPSGPMGFDKDSGLSSKTRDSRWAGGAGAERSSLGTMSIPPLPSSLP